MTFKHRGFSKETTFDSGPLAISGQKQLEDTSQIEWRIFYFDDRATWVRPQGLSFLDYVIKGRGEWGWGGYAQISGNKKLKGLSMKIRNLSTAGGENF